MASSTLAAPGSGRSIFKTVLWISLGLIVLFVFITSEFFSSPITPCTTLTASRSSPTAISSSPIR